MYYLVFYVILCLLIFYKMKKVSKKEKNSFIEVSNDNANKLRGIFAIIIIIAHCTLIFEKVPLVLMPFGKVSTLCVGYFFAMSGYGLAYSYENKNNYLHKFLPNKLLYIFVVAGIALGFSAAVRLLFELFANVDIGLVMTNWYIWCLAIQYVNYYICYKFFPQKNKNILLLFSTVILTFIALILKLPRPYFISEWAFPIGALLYEYRDKINTFVKEKFIFIISILIVILIISIYSFFAIEYSIADLILHNLLFIPFYFVILFICYNFKFSNKAIDFLSKISFELYIYQFISMNIVTKIMELNNISRGILYILIVLFLDLLISVVMKKVNKFILDKSKRRFLKKEKVNAES